MCRKDSDSLKAFIPILFGIIYGTSETYTLIQGVLEKITNRMLLEPRCTGPDNRSWHSLSLEIVFCSFLTKAGSSASFRRENLASKDSILPRIFFLFNSYILFSDTL